MSAAPPPGASVNLYADEVNLVMDERKRAAEESYAAALDSSEGEEFDDLDQLEVSDWLLFYIVLFVSLVLS